MLKTAHSLKTKIGKTDDNNQCTFILGLIQLADTTLYVQYTQTLLAQKFTVLGWLSG